MVFQASVAIAGEIYHRRSGTVCFDCWTRGSVRLVRSPWRPPWERRGRLQFSPYLLSCGWCVVFMYLFASLFACRFGGSQCDGDGTALTSIHCCLEVAVEFVLPSLRRKPFEKQSVVSPLRFLRQSVLGASLHEFHSHALRLHTVTRVGCIARISLVSGVTF